MVLLKSILLLIEFFSFKIRIIKVALFYLIFHNISILINHFLDYLILCKWKYSFSVWSVHIIDRSTKNITIIIFDNNLLELYFSLRKSGLKFSLQVFKIKSSLPMVQVIEKFSNILVSIFENNFSPPLKKIILKFSIKNRLIFGVNKLTFSMKLSLKKLPNIFFLLTFLFSYSMFFSL